jgi:hypothetical protein
MTDEELGTPVVRRCPVCWQPARIGDHNTFLAHLDTADRLCHMVGRSAPTRWTDGFRLVAA